MVQVEAQREGDSGACALRPGAQRRGAAGHPTLCGRCCPSCWSQRGSEQPRPGIQKQQSANSVRCDVCAQPWMLLVSGAKDVSIVTSTCKNVVSNANALSLLSCLSQTFQFARQMSCVCIVSHPPISLKTVTIQTDFVSVGSVFWR